ncbi:hypothetical protein IDH44_22110 [Paenibacillus sp. IB182496]|uniref:DUF4309 domain-containing protein n=1 Tax=Paenibacillus sabuli TaxID=2772509 RepID=A0A927BYS7_9BACL|nr:hypothetical protein [Paenibacillus sabuli]MBD2847899.1 hypothetical protein [Paenibacillus sabuli]
MNKQAMPLYIRSAAGAAAALLLAGALGCAADDQPPVSGGPSNVGTSSPEDTSNRPDGQSSPQQAYDSSLTENQPEDGLALPDDGVKTPGKGEDADSGDADDSTTQERQWNTERPLLKNVSIGMARSDVEARFGQPRDAFTMQGDSETVEVNDYDGFSIGFDSDGHVIFVEVHGPEATTGLNGLRIGGDEEMAIEALGKPTNHTTYVLSYAASGSLLKLDMDPHSGEILSIKLFAN